MREISFHASWDRTNLYLQRPAPSRCKSFFLAPFHALCRRAIVPATQIDGQTVARVEQLWQDRWEPRAAPGETTVLLDRDALLLRTHYEAVILNLTTPDGVPIQATLYRSRTSPEMDIPTILCVQPNAHLSRSGGWNWLLKKGCKSPQPFHVITFDYRACGPSGGTLSSLENLELDAETVYQAARDQLQISEHNLRVMGYSMGGAVAAKLLANHQDSGRCVNLHSFSSLVNVFKDSPEIDRKLRSWRVPAALRSATRPLRSCLGSILSRVGWGMDVREALGKIKTRTLFVYHPEDPLIPKPAAAVNGAQLNELQAVVRAVRLQFKPTVRCECPGFNHHIAPLYLYRDSNGLNASKRILNHLLGSNLFVQRKPVQNPTRMMIDASGKIVRTAG